MILKNWLWDTIFKKVLGEERIFFHQLKQVSKPYSYSLFMNYLTFCQTRAILKMRRIYNSLIWVNLKDDVLPTFTICTYFHHNMNFGSLKTYYLFTSNLRNLLKQSDADMSFEYTWIIKTLWGWALLFAVWINKEIGNTCLL